ncbi:RNA polymerase sigma factor [Aquimarina sp. 2201CG14-23]|uniref:RNA polymerase sigma factor n=1 Tax=Aquimarina mycalae TaxID=3040073 RepID=UPI002477F744|nr:sigma-70 family RNA polymerase sigma factor [Aquimarina sp. 2201CG14-23]MDH7446966.1 sigma-70 family RNA polymerase sigma factor [Aquimarina sp. 2201CG14-23]
MIKQKDLEYLEGLRNGNTKTIHAIYNVVFPKVRDFILNNRGKHQDAEEVFHNALFQLTIRLKISNIEIKSSFEAYLFTVCKNLWRKELNVRKKWVRKEEFLTLKAEEYDHSEAIIAQERWELFEKKIELLSPNCRELLKAYFKKIPYAEIIKRFNYSSDNVAFQRIFKCKKQLADLIKKDSSYKKLKM